MTKLDEFLAGERPDDVAIFLAEESLDSEGKLREYGQAVEGGVVLVAPGIQGKNLFRAGTGMEAMEFAKEAMDRKGHVDRDLTGGTPPSGEGSVRYVFAFAEEQKEDVGGLYAEGDVIHAYAYCDDGTAFSDKWVVGEVEADDASGDDGDDVSDDVTDDDGDDVSDDVTDDDGDDASED